MSSSEGPSEFGTITLTPSDTLFEDILVNLSDNSQITIENYQVL